ncbi:MAG: DUF2284 domain-containing protein [Lachnospiraceae bacterium]|nr:DUF2284 domain-containing protein [Lachnospiraceae bacterium]
MYKMDFVKLCLSKGAKKAEAIPVEKLILMPELREFCEQNKCGRFGRNYTCPPYVGEKEELIKKIKSYKIAIIWQNIYELEDSFDFEGMMDGQEKHNQMTLEIAEEAYQEMGRDKVLVLAAGGCTLCPACASLTDEPCRNPGRALSSLEAYGINVAKIEEISGLKYINGKDTVTYFSGLFM